MRKIKSLFVLLVCGVMYFMLAVGSGTNVSTSTDSNGTTSQSAKIATYKMNEDIYITTSSGKYRVKFTGIKETKDRNQFSDTKADRVVIIEYEYENMTKDQDLYVSSLDFKAYDKQNNALETYPASVKYPSNVGKGRKATASVAYALNSTDNYIELEYYDNMFNDNADCKVIFEW